MDKKLADRLRETNETLDRVKIRIKGDRFYLRATLPPKPGELRPKQRDRRTGLPAALKYLKQAKALAEELQAALALDKFQWGDRENGAARPQTIKEAIAAYTAHHWEINPDTPTKRDSWERNRAYYLSRLPGDKALSPENLRAAIVALSQPGTYSRSYFCQTCTALAKFAGIQTDFSELRKGARHAPILPSDLPTDSRIVEIWEGLKSPAWQWIYGMLAAYGLRPSEIFQIDLATLVSGEPLRINGGKTGERLIYPCPAGWIDRFNLRERIFPDFHSTGLPGRVMGNKITQGFANRKLPHTAYKLRHAYAVRTALYGVPTPIAAKWMGHSEVVHSRTYHQAIGQIQHEAIYAQMKRIEGSLNSGAPQS